VSKNIDIEPFNLVLFGGTGDLAFRKIYPSFYHRIAGGHEEVDFSIIVAHRDELSETDFFEKLKTSLKSSLKKDFSADVFKRFLSHVELSHTPSNTVADYTSLKAAVEQQPNRQNIFYFSTPSFVFGEIATALRDSGLVNQSSKVVLEKPLGHDLKSSVEINNQIVDVFEEDQIYRIDHYLGKETVQNLMVLRFANNLFERAWNSEDVDNVQITVSESLGVEKRVDYYDQSGALRDMVQNHLLQLLCLVAMEPPVSLEANYVRDEKLKVLKALRYFDKKTVAKNSVKGQYTRGIVNDREVNSYLEDIEQYDSKTETFVGLKVFIDNWRWKNVPFYMRTGKRMHKRYSDIVINFKPVKHNIFSGGESIPGNKLIISLQPEERIELVQMTKIPGPGGYRYRPISLKLDYMDSFTQRLPEAYERLILDVIRGNQTLFMRHDELRAAWQWTESVLEAWEETSSPNILYASGSWGPGESIMDNGTEWSNSKDK